MRLYVGEILLSPGDLVAHLGCRHASSLNLRALIEGLACDEDEDPTLKLLQAKGIEHELAYLTRLEAEGRRVIHVADKAPLADRVAMTLDAMRSGADVVYQAALRDGMWHGFADFLEKADAPSQLGAWSYDVADTKLSSSVKPRYAVQLSIYSDLVAKVQGKEPERMSVALGDGRIEALRPGDFVHYVRLAAQRLEDFLADDRARAATVAEPCAWCGMCRWQKRCEAEWESADHLSLVANIRRSQRDKLTSVGIGTVAALAAAPEGLKVPNLAAETFAKLRRQANLQVAVRGTDRHLHELLPAAPGRGFARLPPPAEGDLFFDMEGDPLIQGGLEYLFGVWVGSKDDGAFHAFWGHDRVGERRAFEEFIAFVAAHLERHPAAHIYHYNHYEVTAVRRLAMQHAVGEGFVDDLLRRNRFVDLLKVVREALLISEPAYSLKNVEHFYMPKREGEVATAGDSIVAYEAWRVTGEQRILDEIESYNEIDCRSTAGLRDWLLTIRPPGTPWFDPAALAPTPEEQAKHAEAEARRLAIEAALLTGVPQEERPFRQTVADLVEFFRRESKPEWWALFDRQGRDEDEHVEDPECLGALRLVGKPVPEKSSLLWPYSFPPQETKLKKGQKVVDADTGQDVGSIHSIDMAARRVALKRSGGAAPLSALSLGPGKPIANWVLRDAVSRFADDVAHGGGTYRAVEALLRREPPRLRGHAPGQPLVAAGQDLLDAAIAAVAALDESWLFIQGPPGTGKTWTASRVIVEMMRRGLRVGVSSHSHKAINCLLAGIEKAAVEQGFAFTGYKKSSTDDPDSAFDGRFIRNVTDNKGVPVGAQLKAGTAWLFARPEFKSSVDVLFVDEAGQVSLGGLVAMGTAARNIVLVGDQMQLGNPVKGVHPGESGSTSLEYLLQGAPTVPPDRGIFLDQSWRMHPSLCGWVSEAIYEGRLRAAPSTERQSLLLGASAHPALAPHGLRFHAVEHTGRAQSSPEEADAIRTLWASLIGQRWRDWHGVEHSLGPDDVLVVAPYNAQVNLIKAALPDGARIGTVDKFQGQEAPVVLLSMTSSSGDDMPRGVDFLFSRNRLNVAVSRARCLSVIVANPRLLEVSCNKLGDMRLVDTLCHAYEWSDMSTTGRGP